MNVSCLVTDFDLYGYTWGTRDVFTCVQLDIRLFLYTNDLELVKQTSSK